MKSYETSSCGYTLKFNGPDTVEAYDAKAGKEGTCLDDAILRTIYRDTIIAWQESFASLLQERTGIARGLDEEATTRVKARSKSPENVTPLRERIKDYNSRVVAEWGADSNGDKKEQLQTWAQEAADTIEVLPRGPTIKLEPVNKADLAKAQEILSHEPDYIEERVALMLADLPSFALTRNAEDGKPEAESLARLINQYITAKLKL